MKNHCRQRLQRFIKACLGMVQTLLALYDAVVVLLYGFSRERAAGELPIVFGLDRQVLLVKGGTDRAEFGEYFLKDLLVHSCFASISIHM